MDGVMTKTEKSILLSLLFFLLAGSILYFYRQQSEQTELQVITPKEPNTEKKSPLDAISLEPKRVELNLASAQDLERIPTIGPALARAIIDYRNQQGAFKKVEEILNVHGFGKGRYKKVWELLYVDGKKGIHPSHLFKAKTIRRKKTPEKIIKQPSIAQQEETWEGKLIDINKATLNQLMSLPRVGKKLAARIVQHRETYGPFLVKEELFEIEGMSQNLFEKIEPYIEVK